MEARLDAVAAQPVAWGSWCRDLWLCHELKPYKDEPMTPADWHRHASWRRHLPEPRMFLRVLRVLSVIEAWTLCVCLLVAAYATYLRPRPGWPAVVDGRHMVLFQLASFVLALLLVFRTNAAHARWWEARTLLGRALAAVRTMARLAAARAARSPADAAAAREFARYNGALTAAISAYLTRDPAHWRFVEGLLTPVEAAELAAADNPPVAVMAVMAELLMRMPSMCAVERMQAEAELAAVDLCLAGCERIGRAAIPRAYTRHTSRCLIAFVTFLPFALWDHMGWLTLPAMFAFTFLMFGIENIGIILENPVTVLPMHAFSRGNRLAAEEAAAYSARAAAVADALLGVRGSGGGGGSGGKGGAVVVGGGGNSAAAVEATAAGVALPRTPPQADGCGCGGGAGAPLHAHPPMTRH